MKALFRSVYFVATMVIACTSALLSCSDKEEVYDFVFDIPGSVVTEPGSTIVMPFTAHNITSVSLSAVPKGWEVKNIDMLNWTVTIVAPKKYTAEDPSVEENGSLKLNGYTAAGTSIEAISYLSLLNQSIDLTSAPSNCYVLTQKDTRYTIDVTHKGESSEQFTPAAVELTWQSQKNFIQYFGLNEDNRTFTFFVGNEEVKDDDDNVVATRIPDGNAVIAAYDADGKVIWSWHIWATGSDVESSAITASNGVVFMDRNLGAYHNPDGSTNGDDIYSGYGMYYQWGRKDPFNRPYDYAFKNNNDKPGYSSIGSTMRFQYADAENSTEAGTLEFAVAHPMTFVRGSEDNAYDWLYSGHNDQLWNAQQKSMYDPCPRGWRVPDGDAFEVFDIDVAEDMAAMVDMRGRYGWHLVDKVSGVEMFMPAAGRKSFETGVFTNVNNYGGEHPSMPWIGYYWTAGKGSKEAMSSSMYFDLNTTRAVNNGYETKKDMYRANAMQIRCVRDTK